MSNLAEITRLFAQLAADLQRSNDATVTADDRHHGSEVSRVTSSLTESFNSGNRPISRVLDAALSLMCFKMSEVCEARIETQVRTIISVLSSLSSCKVWRLGEGRRELLQVGCTMSSGELDELIGACADAIESLKRHGKPSHDLSYAALKAAVAASSYPSPLPLSPISHGGHEKNSDRKAVTSRLTHVLHNQYPVTSHEILSRLRLWHLDPWVLKHDISEMLQETVRRPFLCLKEEFHSRMAWRFMTICLVTCPTAFIATRALLHCWFLATGLASILGFKVALVASVLDVLSRPMWWGLSIELGQRYPFSQVYFACKHHGLLKLLTGPVSCTSFLHLVHLITMVAAPEKENLHPISFPSEDGFMPEAMLSNCDDISVWAILMDFPSWFYLASAIIFSGVDSQISCLLKGTYQADKAIEMDGADLHHAAVHYLSWILCPLNEDHRDLLADRLKKVSSSWTEKCSFEQRPCSDSHNKIVVKHIKKLRVPKANDSVKSRLAAADDGWSTIAMWLKDFHNVCVSWGRKNATDMPVGEKAEHSSAKQHLLLLKIPLGFFISHPGFLDGKGTELLLHYAATGEILDSEDMKKVEGSSGHDDMATFSGGDGQWALCGACLVFELFDIIEDMSDLLFDREHMQFDFISKLKSKAGRYLLRCVKGLLEHDLGHFQIEQEARRDTMMDLYRRLMRWRKQGQKVVECCKEFDEVFGTFAKRFAFTHEQHDEG